MRAEASARNGKDGLKRCERVGIVRTMNGKRASQVLPCGRALPKPPKHTPSAEALRQALAKLEAYVAARKLNRSEAREKILETIISEARHFRAPELLQRLHRRHPEVGKATLYRNLPVLVESGIIQEGPTDSEGQTLFELADEDHHDHIVCMDCQRIFEFHDDSIEDAQAKVAKKSQFTVRSHRHMVYASCDYLAKKASKPSPGMGKPSPEAKKLSER